MTIKNISPVQGEYCDHSSETHPRFRDEDTTDALYMRYSAELIEDVSVVKQLCDAGRYRRAMDVLDEILSVFPDSPDLVNMKGEMLSQSGNKSEARRTFLHVARTWPGAIKAAYQNLEYYLAQDPYDEETRTVLQDWYTWANRKLHIGGQQAHPDWEVLDVYAGPYVDHVGNAKDLSRFPDESFTTIYASHVLEHFDFNRELETVLTEWKRILRPGGRLLVSVPDLGKICALFLMRDAVPYQDHFMLMCMMFGGHINNHDYHYVGFDRTILENFLVRTGFVNLTRVDEFGIFNDTSCLKFHGISISLNMIAEKP